MIEPRRRILVTSIVALAVALGVSLVVIARQQGSGRAALTERATEFVRLLKGPTVGPGHRGESLRFLRPQDRESPALLEGLDRLVTAFSGDGGVLDITEVELLGDGHGRTFSPGSGGIQIVRGRARPAMRQIDWIRGGDGRWYVDPTGL